MKCKIYEKHYLDFLPLHHIYPWQYAIVKDGCMRLNLGLFFWSDRPCRVGTEVRVQGAMWDGRTGLVRYKL